MHTQGTHAKPGAGRVLKDVVMKQLHEEKSFCSGQASPGVHQEWRGQREEGVSRASFNLPGGPLGFAKPFAGQKERFG